MYPNRNREPRDADEIVGASSKDIREHIFGELLKIGVYDFDWDNNGALPIRPDVRGFIDDRFFDVFHEPGLPLPSVTLEPDGTLSLLFLSPRKAWRITILTDKAIHYACMIGKNGTYSGSFDGYFLNLDDEELRDRFHEQASWILGRSE